MSIELSEDGQAIRRLMGEGLSPDGIAAALDCHLQKVKQAVNERPAEIKQAWVRSIDVQKLYGLKKSRADELLRDLSEAGKVRMQKPSGTDKRGIYYNLSDIEKAWSYQKA